MVDATDARHQTRERLIEVASGLLREAGRSAVTTRGVADRAGVQPPTIYRLFGDKDGLLQAVAEHAMAMFASEKAATVASAAADGADPVEDLRAGWNMTIDFGISNPDLFVLLSDPTQRAPSPATLAGTRLLADRVHRVALAGRLRVNEELAVDLIHAAGTGAILATLAHPAAERDRRLADSMFDAILRQLVTDIDDSPVAGTPISAAVAVRAKAAHLQMLTAGERAVLTEWLDRIIGQPSADGDSQSG